MTPQESQTLQDFLDQLMQARGVAKDPQAEALIIRAIAQQPDAAYLLVQRAMLLEQALNQSKAQISQLQHDLQTARTSTATSFLDSNNSWGRGVMDASRPASVPANPPQSLAAVQSPTPSNIAKPGFLSGGTGNFLTNVAATAAGVAGGAFLFQGIENLMGHHHGQSSGLLGQSGMTGVPVENTTINNYYAGDTLAVDSNNEDFANLDLYNVDNSSDDGLTSI